MKKILPALLILIISSTLILSYLTLLNVRAGAGEVDKTVTCFNHSNATAADTIFSFWKNGAGLLGHAKELCMRSVVQFTQLDMLFILVYTILLLYIQYQLRKNAVITATLKKLLVLSTVCLIVGAVIDLLQDIRLCLVAKGVLELIKEGNPQPNFQLSAISAPFQDIRPYSQTKLILIALSVLIVVVAIASGMIREWKMHTLAQRDFLKLLRRFLSQFFKCLWIFFPAILFLLLTIAAFWMAGQGKDIIVAFTSNAAATIGKGALTWNYTRPIFFLAIAFWAYVSWYSSRVVFYTKQIQNEQPVREIEGIVHKTIPTEGNSYPNISTDFMREFPRMIGNACFLVLELALLQSPMMVLPITSSSSWILFIELVFSFYFVNQWAINFAQNRSALFNTLFNLVGFLLLLVIVILGFGQKLLFASIFIPIVLLHILYILYTNIHRQAVYPKAGKTYSSDASGMKKYTQYIMQFFCIPPEEVGYYKWFIYIGTFGILCYFSCVHLLPAAIGIGPFSFALLAFGVLLALGNLVTAFSIKYKINIHFILLITAFVINVYDNHTVRQHELKKNTVNKYKADRPDLKTYLNAWLTERARNTDTMSPINMYFVMSNGGASRSGFWSAAVLGRLEDSTRMSPHRFSDQVFCLSGTSGGGVGVACFFSVLKKEDRKTDTAYERSMEFYLKKDYFTHTFARLLSYDYFRYLSVIFWPSDRAAKLEESFEIQAKKTDPGLIPIPFDNSFSSFQALRPDGSVQYPLLFINTTRVQGGTPGVLSNLIIDRQTFNSRVDVIQTLPENCDLSLATASILGARFPYLSPAGRINNSDYVDGGYFDNSGAGVVQELIRKIISISKDSVVTAADAQLVKLINRVSFHVLHIVNSPIEGSAGESESITPIQNDLFAPVLTILGAYEMQTTVNDGRLINYINDLRTYNKIPAEYSRISLYQSKNEWKNDTNLHKYFTQEPEYAFNWFMSDTTANRIIARLDINDSLNNVIKRLKTP